MGLLRIADLLIITLSLYTVLGDSTCTKENNDTEIAAKLSRQKRYLAFPAGSVMQLGYCLTIRSIIPKAVFAIGFTFGTNWELPSEPLGKRPKQLAEVVHRMDRRSLYNKIATVLQMLGVDGRSCIFKALCEAGQRPKGAKGSFIEEIIHTMFRLPPGTNFEDDEDLQKYDKAHRTKKNCTEMFSTCATTFDELIETE